tara:strand:- start:305 stop:1456 length:1152 start_codon:yes stop_codon:yes gene_type:complete
VGKLNFIVLLIIGGANPRRLRFGWFYCAPVIDREELLSSFVRDLNQAEWVAVDTEADSLHAYPEKLCLMQLSIPSDDVLVDPLAGMEMGEFFSSLGTKTLIMHGADYDVRLFKMGCGFVPKSIFDTMLAARLLGRRQFGLSHLTKEILGVELEKTSQKANWAKRPLTDKMSEYALNDTRHLQPLAKALKSELEATGRIEWHSQECDRLIRDNSNINTPDPDKIWRIKGSARLSSQALGVLRELWLWREKEAKRRNRPPYFVLSPDIMIKISDASAQGVEIEQWIPRRVPEHRRREIRKCIKHAISCPSEEWPAPHKPPPRKHITSLQKQRFEDLQKRRDCHADSLSIDPTIIASRATMVKLACGAEGVLNDVLPWQQELLGVG